MMFFIPTHYCIFQYIFGMRDYKTFHAIFGMIDYNLFMTYYGTFLV